MLAWIFFSCWHEFFYFKKFMLAWIFSKPLVSISNTIFGSPDQPRPPPPSLLGWRTPITLARPCYYTRVGRKCLPTGNNCQISLQYCTKTPLCIFEVLKWKYVANSHWQLPVNVWHKQGWTHPVTWPHIPPKGERRALGYSELASLAKQVHTTSGIYGRGTYDWNQISIWSLNEAFYSHSHS